jgi:uncharacterized protein
MGLPPSEGPASTPPPPTGTDRLEAGIASLFVGPDGIRAGWRWLIFLIIVFVVAGFLLFAEVAAGLLHLNRAPSTPVPLTASLLLKQEIALAIGAFVAAFIMSKIERRPMGQYGLPLSEAFGKRFWQGIVWGFVAITVTLLFIAALHGFSFGTIALSGTALLKYASAWALVFLLTGYFEEFTFRGYSQFTLARGMHFWPAAILLSILFGSIHLGNVGESWVGGLTAGLIGLFFCFTLRRTGNIWFAVGLHAAWDYGETFVYGVPDSGLVSPGHFFDSSFHGPRWLTGGSVGPEGSVFCVLVIALLFLVFHFAHPARKGQNQPS